MAEFIGKDLHRYFTWVANSTSVFIRSSETNLRDGFDQDMIQAKNQVLGGIIITFIARLEKELNKQQGAPWPNIDNFYAKEEFLNFCLLRHCFAHAGGFLLPNRKAKIKSFEIKLGANKILDYKKEPVFKYYSTDANDLIILNYSCLNRISTLSKELLAINGLIDKKRIHESLDW